MERLHIAMFNSDNQMYNIYNLKYYNCKKLFVIFVVYFCNLHAEDSSKFI